MLLADGVAVFQTDPTVIFESIKQLTKVNVAFLPKILSALYIWQIKMNLFLLLSGGHTVELSELTYITALSPYWLVNQTLRRRPANQS